MTIEEAKSEKNGNEPGHDSLRIINTSFIAHATCSNTSIVCIEVEPWKGASIGKCTIQAIGLAKKNNLPVFFVFEDRPVLIRPDSEPIACSRCGSHDVDCDVKYDTPGATMEYGEWKHTCRSCGHVDEKLEEHCYGYSNRFDCPFPGCSNWFYS